MKIPALILLAFLGVNTSFAQKNSFSPANTKNNLKIGLNTSFVGDRFGFAVAWEFKVANKQSVQVELLPIFLKTNYDKTNGIGVALSYRKYLSKNREGLQGIYFSPMVKVSTLSETNSYRNSSYNTVYKTNHFNAALLFGRQWVYKSGFSLDINGGIGFYRFNDNNGYYYTQPFPNTNPVNPNINYGLSPNLNIKVGYAF
jgi:Protein of unknown function (DUF3575)